MRTTRASKLAPSGVALCGLLLSLGCGGSRPPADTTRIEGDQRSEADLYMPLENGAVFTYETTSSDGADGLFTIQVRRVAPDRADLRMGGRTKSVRIGPDGLAFLEGGYLLKAPIQVGAAWQGETGIVQIEAGRQSIEVPAGRFQGCIRTRETTRTGALIEAATYCPRVGLVALEQQRERGTKYTARLKSHGPSTGPFP